VFFYFTKQIKRIIRKTGLLIEVKKISTEKKIFNYLQGKTKQRDVISQETGISRTTCYKYLKRLQKKGKVFRVKEKERGRGHPKIFWTTEKPTKQDRLSLKQEKILEVLKKAKQKLTRKDIIKKTKIKRTTCRDNLIILKEKGLILQETEEEHDKVGRPKEFFIIK
jgi:predicted ArsR family transcriptional regulator